MRRRTSAVFVAVLAMLAAWSGSAQASATITHTAAAAQQPTGTVAEPQLASGPAAWAAQLGKNW